MSLNFAVKNLLIEFGDFTDNLPYITNPYLWISKGKRYIINLIRLHYNGLTRKTLNLPNALTLFTYKTLTFCGLLRKHKLGKFQSMIIHIESFGTNTGVL